MAENAKGCRIGNPEVLLEDYKRVIDRGADLLADVAPTDTDGLAAVAKAEIYDKPSHANYDMN
ncbi:hypothetical protein WNY61_18920 [Sulfitobacter sp. AS92]|uniref:hypothetical protein n=1 Tax=Sulfitobacter sp. AS92 TaxID=3135783 RepID=UPI00316CE2F2